MSLVTYYEEVGLLGAARLACIAEYIESNGPIPVRCVKRMSIGYFVEPRQIIDTTDDIVRWTHSNGPPLSEGPYSRREARRKARCQAQRNGEVLLFTSSGFTVACLGVICKWIRTQEAARGKDGAG